MSQSTRSVSGDPLNMLATAAASSSVNQSYLEAIEISSGALRDTIRQTDQECFRTAVAIQALSHKISESNHPNPSLFSLQTLVGRLTTDLTDQQKKLAAIVMQVQAKQTAISSCQRELDETADILKSSDVESSHLEKQGADLLATILSMNAAMENFHKSIDFLKNAGPFTEGAQKELIKSIQANQSDRNEVENRRKTIQSRLAALREISAHIETKQGQITDTRDSYSKDIEQLKGQVSAIESAISDQEKVVAEKTRQLKEEEHNKKAQLDQWTQDLENAKKEKARLEKKSEALRMGISLLERQTSSRQLSAPMEIDSEDETEAMTIADLARQAASSSSAPPKKRPLEIEAAAPAAKRRKVAILKEMVKDLAPFYPSGTVLQHYNQKVKMVALLHDEFRKSIGVDFLIETIGTGKRDHIRAQDLTFFPEVGQSYLIRNKQGDSKKRYYWGKVLEVSRTTGRGFQCNTLKVKVQWLESQEAPVELSLLGLDSFLPIRHDSPLMDRLFSERVPVGTKFKTGYSLI